MTPEREAEIRAEHDEPRDGRCDACDLLVALDAERKAHEETRRNGREDRNLLLRVVEHIASRVGMEPEGLWEDPSSIEHGLASVRAAACAEADLAHHHTMGLLLEARESLRQLEREYRCAECLHNVARAEQAKAVLADVRQRCSGYPDSRVDGDGGIVAVVVRERDEARETARRDADLRDDAEQQRNQAQAALVALREAARGVGYACAAAATWSDDPRPALLALDAAAAATPTTLAGQVRARVLRDIADSLDAEAAMPNDGNVHTLRHVMFWERMTPIEGRVVAAWLRALADEAEETR